MELELIPGSETTGPDPKQTAKDGRITMAQPKGMPRGKLRFRASSTYQEVLEDHFLPVGLEIQMDVASGKNMARLCRGQEVDLAGAKDNYPMVQEALRLAATHNDVNKMRKLLATCFYDSETMNSALLEACGKGYADIVDLLLVGGMSRANPVDVDMKEGQSALHRAMMNGHEDICKALIDVLPDADAARPLNRKQMDPFAAARDEDLGGVARRMEKYVAEHTFTGSDTRGQGSNTTSSGTDHAEKQPTATGQSPSFGRWWIIIVPVGAALIGWMLKARNSKSLE